MASLASLSSTNRKAALVSHRWLSDRMGTTRYKLLSILSNMGNREKQAFNYLSISSLCPGFFRPYPAPPLVSNTYSPVTDPENRTVLPQI